MSNFIYIARHAWAYHFGDDRWPDDAERPLEFDGAERYQRVVEALAERGFEPDIVATSPYVRCRQTADLISSHTLHHPPVEEVDALQPGSSFEALVNWTKAKGRKNVCWVGHAPDVGNLTAALVGDSRADIRFAKGAIAAIRLYEPAGYGCGELYWLATAKSLGV